MHSVKVRKPHKKSRNGCLMCKSRHIKCDEQKPQCARCASHGNVCEYARSVSRGMSVDNILQATNFADGSNRATLHADYSEPRISQLRLLHQFITDTAGSLAASRDAELLWTSHAIQVAFCYPSLLHLILAFAAQHLSRQVNSSGVQSAATESAGYRLEASQHYDAAFRGFRAEMREINQSNYEAVYLFGSIMFPYSCASVVDEEICAEQTWESLISNLVLTRRMKPMVRLFYLDMKNSKLGGIIPEDVNGIDWATREPPAETELLHLRKLTDTVHHVVSPDVFEACSQAIRVLEVVFAAAGQSQLPPSISLLKIWFHHIPEHYVELLKARQPVSLVIFAHYAALLSKNKHLWFLEGLANRILDIVDTLLPLEWKSWLDWPKNAIRTEQMHKNVPLDR